MPLQKPVPAANAPRAFTLIELLTVIAIIAILAAILIPIAGRVRQQARLSNCQVNVREWGAAALLYANDDRGMIPWDGGTDTDPTNVDEHFGTSPWFNALPPYLGSPTILELDERDALPRLGDTSVFICPSAVSHGNAPEWLNYGPNYLLSLQSDPGLHRIPITRLDLIREPSRVPLFSETTNHSPNSEGFQALNANPRYLAEANRHDGRAPVVFFDGHVEIFTSEELAVQSRVWDNPNAPVRIRWNPKYQ